MNFEKCGRISRRQWLAVTGVTAGATAMAQRQALDESIRTYTPPPANPRAPVAPVALAKCPDYDQDLAAILGTMFDQIGGIGTLVRNKTVTVKLNLTGGGEFPGFKAGDCTWVNPKVIGAVVALLDKNGARRVRLAEGCGGGGRRPGAGGLEGKMKNGGWDVEAIRSAAKVVEFVNTDVLAEGQKWATLKVAGKPYLYPGFNMNPAYQDTDVFVSLGKMKNHEELGITLSMKNLFGTTPTGLYGSRETTFHYGQKQPPAGAPQEVDPTSNRYEGYRMPRLLTDINGALPIDLAIVDGIVGACGGEGPWVAAARPCKPGLLVVGRNCVNTDAVGAAAMGYNPRAGRTEPPFRVYKPVPDGPGAPPPPPWNQSYADNLMLLSEAVGIGSADLSRIDVRGLAVKDAAFNFEAEWKGQVVRKRS